MNRNHWIICERGPRWAAALRQAINRRKRATQSRLVEVRRLKEATTALASHPGSVVAVEVHSDNLKEALDWLPSIGRQFPDCCAVALASDAAAESAPLLHAVLREAGAMEIATSPRRLEGIMHVAQRHFHWLDADDGATADVLSRIGSNLPWQPQPRPVG